MAGVEIVVFSDLVDSTALLATLGDDRMEAVRRTHVKDVKNAVALDGGQVKNAQLQPTAHNFSTMAVARSPEVRRRRDRIRPWGW